MSSLTREKIKTYVDNGGASCPYCLGDIESPGVHDVEAEFLFEPMKCLECEKTWKNVYKLVDIAVSPIDLC